MTEMPSDAQEFRFTALDDWQRDREWINQCLANERISLSKLENKLAELRADVEEICQQRATSPITRARLRHALAGVDWRKAK